MFGYENQLDFPIYFSHQDSMDLLLSIDNDQSHSVYTKYFDRFMFHKIKKKGFARFVYNVLVVKMS